MKNLKKIVTLVFSLMLLTTMFTACKDEKTASSTTETVTTTEAAPEVTAEVAPEVAPEVTTEAITYPADVQAIIDRGVLRVGVKNAVIGFGFQDPLTQEYTGLEISIAEKIAENLGVDVEFTAVTAATRTELLDSGDIDCVLATFTITDERKKSWDYSTPYFTDFVTVLVEDSSGINSLEGLVDKKIGVSSGSTSAKALVNALIEGGFIPSDSFNADTFDPATWTEKVSFQQYDDYPTISIALSAGEVDAFCVDKSILAVYHTDGRSYIDDKFSPQNYGVATKKDSGFTPIVEALVSGWLADGTIESLITENGLE